MLLLRAIRSKWTSGSSFRSSRKFFVPPGQFSGFLLDSPRAAFASLLILLIPLYAAAVFCSMGTRILALTFVPALAFGFAFFAPLSLGAKWVPLQWTALYSVQTTVLISLIGMGLTLRIAFAMLVHPAPVSDMASYEFSARHLLTSYEYVCREHIGLMRAFRPPGVAFLLAGTMAVVGQQAWAALLLNCILYIGSSVLIWRAFDSLPWQASIFGVAMLSAWPSDIAVASLPQSETPTVLFSAALIYVLLKVKGLTAKAILLGFITGLSCLVRNSNLLMIGVWWFVLLQSPASVKKRVVSSVLVFVSALLPILPWTMRNVRVLGSPVLVATNGGSVLYSANNPVSGGGWEESSDRQLSAYLPNEVAMDKAGFRLAKLWIRAHPIQFLKLGVEKVRLLLGSDDWGPYWAMARGANSTGEAYLGNLVVSALWWVTLWAAVLVGFIRQARLIRQEVLLQAVTAFTLFPSFLFFVFQSQPRYHAFMIPGLLFLAARMNSFPVPFHAARERR